MNRVVQMINATPGITTRAPTTREAHRSAIRPPKITPGIPPTTTSTRKVPVAFPWVRVSWLSYNWGIQDPTAEMVKPRADTPTSANLRVGMARMTPTSRRRPTRRSTVNRFAPCSKNGCLAQRRRYRPRQGEFQRSSQRTGHDDRATPSDEPLEAPASVSYTHLRAHETRHDLVCR